METKTILAILLAFLVVSVIIYLAFPSIFGAGKGFNSDLTGKTSCTKWVSVNFIAPDVYGYFTSKSGTQVDMFGACQRLTGLYEDSGIADASMAYNDENDAFYELCRNKCKNI